MKQQPYYEDEHITLYHGDCADILPHLPQVDLVLTDPPYGIKRFSKGFGNTRFKGYGAENSGILWDVAPERNVLDLLLNKGTCCIIWGMNYLELPRTEHFLVWSKHQTVDNFASAEVAWTNIKRTKVFDFSIHLHNRRKFGAHPTEKPVELMKWCIELTKEADLILDPFAGSGTTLRAAKDMNRRCIGIEQSKEYCDVIVKRMKQQVLAF